MGVFTHLHLHTEYSLLDGVCHVKELVPYLKEHGFDSCAITDHGVMYGAYQFYSICKENGIKPIIGCEIYLAKRNRLDKDARKDRGTFHMTLLARNLEGYKNLLKIVTIGQLEGMYYKPRVDHEILKKYGSGIIATSGCLNGQIPRALQEGKYNQAKKLVEKFQSYFGKEYFFIEVQRNGVEDQNKVNVLLEQLAMEMDIPIVATCDSHYIYPDDYITQEILWCVGDGKKLSDPDRRRYETTEFYVKTPEEMVELFKDHPEYLENTQKVVSLIEDFDITFGRVEPVFNSLPEGKTADSYLRELVFAGAKKRYGNPLPKHVEERVEYELNLIHDKNYDNYFLVVQDYIKWAKDHDIMVGFGRGSGVGSVVAYSLEITDIVDPLYWNLPFERFLNPERPSPPDFDVDFEDIRRDEVVQYMREKYGEKRVANIAAIGRMKTKAAIRDVARVMGIDLSIADKLSKLVPSHQGKSPPIQEAVDAIPEMQEIINQSPEELNQLVKYVAKVEGTARHISKHACGVVITTGDVVEFTPLQKESRNAESIITQYEGPYLESIGLMKFDFLGLSNLTQIKNTIRSIKKNRGEILDINNIPFDDVKTYEEVFQKGETLGVFQFESEGMRKYLRDLKPETIEEIAFMAAAYRPGPMAYIEPYIDCKFGRKKPEYLHKDLIPVLEETYGYPIYQEQIMQIAVVMAGYSLGRADILRKAMGKKKIEVLMAEQEPFVKAVVAKGYDEELAVKLFDYMVPFSSYGFNKAHSASYAVLAYFTAYLKAHYFPEYMSVLLETNLGDFEKVNMINDECREKGVKILPPDVNLSDAEFLIENGNIRYGLYSLKGGSAKAMEEIIAKRKSGPYTGLEDVCMRVDLSKVTKKNLELLIKSGSMDMFGKRSALLAILPEVFERALSARKNKENGQISLFDQMNDFEPEIFKIQLPNIPESSEKLSWEKEILGIYTSSHPLLDFTQMADRKTVIKIKDLKDQKGKKNIKSIGIITSLKKILTKKDGKPMAFGVFEDLSGKVELVIFPNTYEKCRDKLLVDVPVIVKGSVDVKTNLDKNEEVKFFLEDIAQLDDKFRDKEQKMTLKGKMIIVNVKPDTNLLAKLKELIKMNPGTSAVKLLISNNGNTSELMLKDKVSITDLFLKELSAVSGAEYSIE